MRVKDLRPGDAFEYGGAKCVAKEKPRRAYGKAYINVVHHGVGSLPTFPPNAPAKLPVVLEYGCSIRFNSMDSILTYVERDGKTIWDIRRQAEEAGIVASADGCSLEQLAWEYDQHLKKELREVAA